MNSNPFIDPLVSIPTFRPLIPLRDHDLTGQAFVQQIRQAGYDATHNDFDRISEIYNAQILANYDRICWNHRLTAQMLAREVFGTSPTYYIHLGHETERPRQVPQNKNWILFYEL